jgi:putative tricarboxylic transport membrane protein
MSGLPPAPVPAWRSAFRVGDRLAGIVLVLLSVATAHQAWVLPMGTLRNPGPGYMPLLIAAIMGLLGILIVLGGDGAARRALAWPEARRALWLLGACCFAALALERLGYRLTVLAMMGFFLGAVERKGLVPVLTVSLAMSFGSFYLFADLLRVNLPRGPWGF